MTTGIPSEDLSPWITGMGKKCPPQAVVGIPAGKFFRRRDGELKPDGKFLIAIPSPDRKPSALTILVLNSKITYVRIIGLES
jgi:hypothetical protein